MQARLIARIKEAYGRGTIEGVIWEAPVPAQPSAHRIKYRLVYIVGGERVVGYDNERGKGDHTAYPGRASTLRLQGCADADPRFFAGRTGD